MVYPRKNRYYQGTSKLLILHVEKMDYFYMSLESAKKEIKSRWQNEDLKKKVANFIDSALPSVFSNPCAVLSRNIATPDIECVRFVKLSQDIGLDPIVCEGANDKFSSASSDKVGLVKLSFFDGYDKNNDLCYHYRKIIDIPANDGKKFCDITTLWGENLVDFHHRILKSYIPQNVVLFDDFEWFREKGMKTNINEYYRNFLCFFVCHGVLFENFVTDDSEQEFFETIVKPAFDFVEHEFGVKPLITELAPHNEASNEYWWCYPIEVEKYIDTSIIK